MKKPKIVINTGLTFNDDLKEELQGYINNIYKGTLEKYDVNNF